MSIGIQEVFLISLMALMILGPERLPIALKNILSFSKKIKRSFNKIKADLEREVNINEITQEIHNEQILKELGEPVEQLKKNTADIEKFLNK
jgi:sec-independent protein translocase protein TatB|tara:strand:+ start:725 stop:1000 length:276 start_codon:yes stop_codon:yes gene_type:complete